MLLSSSEFCPFLYSLAVAWVGSVVTLAGNWTEVPGGDGKRGPGEINQQSLPRLPRFSAYTSFNYTL